MQFMNEGSMLLQQWIDDENEDEFVYHQIIEPLTAKLITDLKKKKKRPTTKAPNVERSRQEFAERLEQDYWGDDPTYNLNIFRRRFRMQRNLFDKILLDLSETDPFFTQRYDALGKFGFTPKQKMTAAMRYLAYGASADQLDEFIRMAESTILMTVKKFCQDIIQLYSDEYLRRPNEHDISQLLSENSSRGFPGMLGSLDCMHWQWKNCPYAWKGAYQGKEGAPTIILEAVADRRLWIWHAFFGMAGSNNDINVLDRSNLFDDILQSKNVSVDFFVNGNRYDRCYFLADGIYPDWPVFVKTIEHPVGRKKKLFSCMQESVRKDVERCFGVLQARFRILSLPCKLWCKDAMHSIMKACIILHNMIIENEWNDPALDNEFLFPERESVHIWGRRDEFRLNSPDEIVKNMNALRNKDHHLKLREDLVEHLWKEWGEKDD